MTNGARSWFFTFLKCTFCVLTFKEHYSLRALIVAHFNVFIVFAFLRKSMQTIATIMVLSMVMCAFAQSSA